MPRREYDTRSLSSFRSWYNNMKINCKIVLLVDPTHTFLSHLKLKSTKANLLTLSLLAASKVFFLFF